MLTNYFPGNIKMNSNIKNISREIFLLTKKTEFVNIFTCNKHIVIWSELENSSHVNPCLCALFLGDNMNVYIKYLIELCNKNLRKDDIPVAAIVTYNGKIIGKGINNREKKQNVLGHAEINAILEASKYLKNWNLSDCNIYVTLKPCKMCAEVIKQSRIANVYYLLDKDERKKEYDQTNFIHFESDREAEYCKILSDFFKDLREK